ncbi:interleukin-1 beta [Pelodiscus sinensis]|uniref:Interleukin-1 n=1 Tax=Pelodiscus sinensis TaxID=13735 RepID=K7Z1F2_PELSI|nr:interleukin-1 beta [Pelodiscus sinensis]AFX97767.1 interleukin 1 beta [Pelodiscus sinensis]AGI37647.1 interleukin 1beta [Pelodiscus sinensis]|eukprot:NP_001303977.1 interleukin-1 beta [Pelodiscus sinensis]
MAAVPDMQESLEFCSVSDEQFYEVDQPYLGKSLARCPRSCTLSRSCSACDMGIQLKYTEKTSLRTFRRSVVLLVALEKMKKPKATLFSDNDLSSILDAVFETVSFESHSVTYAVNSIYRYLRSISCEIRDTDQKCFKLEAPAQLVAMHLQGPNIQHQVRLNMALYRPKSGTRVQVSTSFPVALGIKGTSLYLSCVHNGQQPTLQLEEADLLKDVRGPELERFIFYKVESGDTTQFESAAHRGWYICTSPESNQPVAVTNRVGEVFITNYLLTQAKH